MASVDIPRTVVGHILKLIRPSDWTKNVFVLIAFAFWAANAMATASAGEIETATKHALFAFVAFCFVASGFYCINDTLDREKDRAHPVKCKRPVASGAISPMTAVVVGLAFIVAACAIAGSVRFGLLLAIVLYALLQVAYNALLKRIAILDVTTIAAGFALRAAAGALAIDVKISVWLVLCVFFLCLFLGFIKRTCDLVAAERAQSGWRSSAGYGDRRELDFLLGLSAALTMVTYIAYTTSEHAQLIFGSRSIGMTLLSPFVLIAIHRFWRRANEGGSDSPLNALRTDRVVLFAVMCYAGLLIVVLFMPVARTALDAVFLQALPTAMKLAP
jgi:decaprenyl-phosphate phosphoribosyltransferase